MGETVVVAAASGPVGKAVVSGAVRYLEDFVHGLKNTPQALIGLLDGKNFGKLIIRVSAP